MTPMVATSIVPHLGRLGCAYLHTSAHPSDNLGEESVDRVGMSPILILSLCAEIRIDTSRFVYFPSANAEKRLKIRITNLAVKLVATSRGEHGFKLAGFSTT
jgi:hypothetical protein